MTFVNLTETERQLLEIAASPEEPLMLGEDVDAVESLVARGLLVQHEFYFILTDDGRAALDQSRCRS